MNYKWVNAYRAIIGVVAGVAVVSHEGRDSICAQSQW